MGSSTQTHAFSGVMDKRLAFVVVAMVLFASSTVLLHESASWVLDHGVMFGRDVNVRAHSCNAHSIGLVFGYALTQANVLRFRRLVADIRFWIFFYLAQVANAILFYGLLAGVWPTAGVVLSQFVGAASGATFFVICSQVACRCSSREFTVAIMMVTAGITALVHGLFSLLEASAPIAVSQILHVALLGGSALLVFRAMGTDGLLREVYSDDTLLPISVKERLIGGETQKAPHYLMLFLIIGIYSGVFGFLHVVPLAIPLGVFSRVATFLLGSVAAIALFAITVRTNRGEVKVAQIWNRFYRIVFPMVVIAALLGPLTASSEFLPALVVQAGALYYFDALLALGSYAVSRAVNAHPFQVFGRAFLIRAVGFLAGNLVGMMVHDNLVLDSAAFSVIGTIIFTLLVLVTLNMNSEKYAKTVWGLLPHEDPRGMFERRTGELCREMAAEYGLTEREAEVLALLARNKRPKEIGGDLVITVATVRSHVQSIYSKLGVHSHEELMLLLGDKMSPA